MFYLIDSTECFSASPFEKGGLRGIFFAAHQFPDTLHKEAGKLEALKSITKNHA